MPDPSLLSAVESLPAGRYGVAVSGGADSVALLRLLHGHRPDLSLHVIHLDHQTRGAESTGDADFVRELAARLGLPCTISRRDQVEPQLSSRPANRSALYRALRMELFRQVAREQRLDAVALAHHADDQAETILHRLLRGSGPRGLTGIHPRSRLGVLMLVRPLLEVPGERLSAYLREIDQDWREDASNQSTKYLRNRLRRILRKQPELSESLRELGRSCRQLVHWVRDAAPELGESFPAIELARLPEVLAEESARRWLIARGAPAGELSPAAIGRLMEMAADAATAPRQHFPGRILVRRRGGRIFTDPPGPPPARSPGPER